MYRWSTSACIELLSLHGGLKEVPPPGGVCCFASAAGNFIAPCSGRVLIDAAEPSLSKVNKNHVTDQWCRWRGLKCQETRFWMALTLAKRFFFSM
jgi:hypothetical protein